MTERRRVAGQPDFAGGFSLTLRVDAPMPGEQGGMLGPASQTLRTRVYRDLGLKAHSVAWVTVEPGTVKGDATLARLAAERDAGTLIVGSATLTERIDWTLAARAGWFHVSTRTVDDFSLWDSYPACRAGTLPKVHALNHTFVSSAVVAACERRRLRGVSFLRCENRGRKPGEPWFVALPDHGLGRGLDHPWFDRGRWLRDVHDRPDRRSSGLDTGQWAFHQCWLRDEVRSDEMAAALRLCPTPERFTSGLDGLQIVTIPRYWSDALPDADFAFVPWGEDGPNREGKILRFRQLAVSQRAQEALVAERLFDARAFLPVAIDRELQGGQTILDRGGNPIPPMFSPAELAALRRRERQSGGPGRSSG